MQKINIKHRILATLAVLFILLLFSSVSQVSAVTYWGESAEIDQDRSGDSGIANYWIFKGHLEKVGEYGEERHFTFKGNDGKNYSAIGNRVHQTPSGSNYWYSTLAIEFSRQINYPEDTSPHIYGDSGKRDYFGYSTSDIEHMQNGKLSVILPTKSLYEDLKKIYEGGMTGTETDKELWESMTGVNSSYLQTGWKNIILKVAIEDGDDVEVYFIISVDELVKTIETMSEKGAINNMYTDWFNEYSTASADGSSYWVKMNKVLTAHDDNGYRSMITGWNYFSGVTRLSHKSRTGTTYPLVSIHNKVFGTELFPESTPGTKKGVEESWDQSVPLLDGTQNAPQIVYYLIGDGEPTNAAGKLSKVIGRESADKSENVKSVDGCKTLEFNKDTIKFGGETYTLAEEEDWDAEGIKMPPTVHTATTSAGVAIAMDKTYKNYTYNSDTSSWTLAEKSDLKYTVDTSKIKDTQKFTVWYIPVIQYTKKEYHLTLKHVDVESGKILDASKDIDSSVKSDKSASYTLSDASITIGTQKYKVAYTSEDWDAYPPVFLLGDDSAKTPYNKKNWSEYYGKATADHAKKANADTSGKITYSTPSGIKIPSGLSYLVIPVAPEDDEQTAIVYYDVTNGNTVLKTKDTAKFDKTKDYVYNSAYEITDSSGAKWTVVPFSEITADASLLPAMFAWDKNKGGTITKKAYTEVQTTAYKYVKETAASDTLKSDVSKTKKTAKFTLKKNTAEGDTILYIPVTAVPSISVTFVNCEDGGKTVLTTTPVAYDPAAKYTYTRDKAGLIITGTDGRKYRLAKDAAEWGSYAPMFAWSDLGKTGIHGKSYKKAQNDYTNAAPDKRVINDDGATFEKNRNTMKGDAVLYIPVVEVVNTLVINYINDDTGEIVWKQNTTYNTEKKTHSVTLDIDQEHEGITFSIIKSSKATRPAKYTYGRDDRSPNYAYDVAKTKASSDLIVMTDPTTESYKKSKGTVQYKHATGVLEGYVTLYVPVKMAQATITKVRTRKLTTYYTNRKDSVGNIITSGTDAEKFVITDRQIVVLEETTTTELNPPTTLDEDYPTPGDLEGAGAGKYFYSGSGHHRMYTGLAETGFLTESEFIAACNTYNVTYRYGNHADLWNSDYGASSSNLTKSGKITTKIKTVEQSMGGGSYHTAKYFYSDASDPWKSDSCAYRLVEITYYEGVYVTPPAPEQPSEVVIIKGDPEEDPNTITSGQNDIPGSTKDAYSAPDVYTYNYSTQFNIGRAIPTTESFNNGVYIDSWYGHVGLKSYEPTPNAQIAVSAISQYMGYELVYEDVTYQVVVDKYGWHNEYGYWDFGHWEYYGDEYNKGVKVGTFGPVEDPPYGYGDTTYTITKSDWISNYDWGYQWKYGAYTETEDKTENLPTGYKKTTYQTETYNRPRESFDLHNDVYQYKYYYIKDINLMQLSSAKVTIPFVGSSDAKQEVDYTSDIETPYVFITNPWEGNYVNGESGEKVANRYAMIRGANWLSAYSSERNKGESGGSVNSYSPKTHIEIQSDLSWKEIFEGKVASRSVPLTYKGTTRQRDELYIKSYTHAGSGRTVYYIDSTQLLEIKNSCREEAKNATNLYFQTEYAENMNNRLVMHNDTVALKDVTYIREDSPYGGSAKVLIGDSNDNENPDVYTTLASEPYRKGSEQTVTIPEYTYNGAYWNKIEARYDGFPAGGRSAKLTVDDNVHKDDAAIYPTYVDNEPIQVHSPVIAPIVIQPEHTANGKTQANLESTYPQLQLDKSYQVDFEWKSLYKDLAGYSQGYHEDINEGYTEYLQNKYVRFPFPVIMNGRYYPLAVTDTVAGHTVKFTNWIQLDKATEWQHFEFYIPTWVETGLYYDAPAGYSAVYNGWSNLHYGAIEIKCTANNFFNDGIHDYEHYEGGIAQENYAATYKYPVQVSGWLYGFEVVSTNDQSTYGGDDDEADGLFYFPREHNDFKVGEYNRYGTNELRLTYGEDVVDGTGWKYTLPMTTFKSEYLAMGTVRKGTRIGFMLRGILGGGMTDKDIKVEITPTYRLYTKDGKLYSSDSIEMFYNAEFAGETYIAYGGPKDTEYNADLSGNLSNAEFQYAVCRIGSDINCSYGHKYDLICGKYLNTFYTTATLLRDTVQNIRTRRTTYGTLSKLTLGKETMLYTGDEAELEVNKATNGTAAKRYNTTGGLETISQWSTITQKEFWSSMQAWYGKYRIPNNIWVRIVKEDDGSAYYGTFEEWMNEHDYFYSPYEVFEREGYLVLNFDIDVYVDRGSGYECELHYITGGTDMWEKENGGNGDYFAYSGKWKNETGTPEPDGTPVLIDAESGDIAVIDLDSQLGAIDGGEKVPGMLWIE